MARWSRVEDRTQNNGPGTELRELARLFAKLGFIAFGGPAVHIAMMRDEVVVRRKWLSEQHFLDLIGVTNLIPGPNSTEMAIHIGRERAGWRGLLVAGMCFIAPAALIVLAFAFLYERYGSTPPGERILYGISPVIIAIVAQALWGLFRTAVKGWLTTVARLAALVLYLSAGVDEIPLLFGGALVMVALQGARRRWGNAAAAVAPPLGLLVWQLPASIGGLGFLFLTFLKIGSVLFGSGYVLLAFLRSDFAGTGLLSDQQIVDAVAIGQFTPGPVFTTATFIGYLLEGVPGAIVATVGIFLPAFVFVALIGPFVSRARRSPTLSSALDGLNAVSLALMGGVTLQLGRATIVDPFTALIAAVALVLLAWFKVSSVWLVLGGGVVGLAYWGLLG